MAFRNIIDLCEKKMIRVDNVKTTVAWIRRNMKPTTLRRIAPGQYGMDASEFNRLYAAFEDRQREILKKKQAIAKRLTAQREAKRKAAEEAAAAEKDGNGGSQI